MIAFGSLKRIILDWRQCNNVGADDTLNTPLKDDDAVYLLETE